MEPTPGSTYYHYKNSSRMYEIVAVGYLKAEPDMQRVVVYRALYDTPDLGPNPVFVRPLENFIETVEVDGKSVPRFTKIL